MLTATSFLLVAGLDAATVQALTRALSDERDAQHRYEAVMKKHGRRRPFSRIIEAEHRHEEALVRHFKRKGIAVPKREEPKVVSVADSFVEACRRAIEAEKENVALYDALLKEVTDQGVRKTMQKLRAASLKRHLPAFQRCAGGKSKGRCDGHRGRKRHRRGARRRSARGEDSKAPHD